MIRQKGFNNIVLRLDRSNDDPFQRGCVESNFNNASRQHLTNKTKQKEYYN
jgi:hypothetical protein